MGNTLGGLGGFVIRWFDPELCAPIGQEEDFVVGNKGGLFTNAGGEVAAAGAPQGQSSGAGAKPEQPVCE